MLYIVYMYHFEGHMALTASNNETIWLEQKSQRLRASIHQTVRRLTARSREVSKPPDSGMDFTNSSEV